jgi:hypothetical protein
MDTAISAAELPEYVDGVPNISGQEALIDKTIREAADKPLYLGRSGIDFGHIRAACAIALHMHQPLIPAGGHDLRSAAIISNLQHMMDNQGIGDNHNAPVFVWCYKRIGEFVPQLVGEGKQPRAMLEYSGTLLHGLRQMGEHHVIDALKTVTMDPAYQTCVEWLGCPWGHAVAPSTPVQDFKLHVRAWQHHFAAIFGLEALTRVRGFSPSEMALPNHPDVAYDFVKTLKDCGFQWVLVQEHTVEKPDNGHGPELKNLPHRLVCRNSDGEEAEILCLIKTQGSDTKLVAQMQPFYEARGMNRMDYQGKSVPPLVTQIADGENGGVMMNEFPGKFMECSREASGSDTPLMNGTEYLEYLFDSGVKPESLPVLQPTQQKKLFDACPPGSGTEKMAKAIEELRQQDHRFHMEGGSWTDDISWVKGYDDVIGPMERVSSRFNEEILAKGVSTDDPRYRRALYHLLSSQTSCYRYWGEGVWTDYGKEIIRRAEDIISHDF